MSDRQSRPETHQPSKEELEEPIVIDATMTQMARAMLSGGAARREPDRRGSAAAPAATAGRPAPRQLT